MGDNINFKELWQKQITSEPNMENMLLQIKKFKQVNLKKIIISNCLLTATSIFIIWVWLHYQPKLLSTKIGIVLTILAMVVYLLVYNQSFSLFKNITNAQNNKDYLKALLKIKSKQQFLHTTMLRLYFLLLSVGLALYMYEYTSKMKGFWEIVTYGVTIAWVMFNWLYLGPKQVKKEQTRLGDIIHKFERLNNQLTD